MLHGLVLSSLSRVVSSLIPRNLCPPHLPVDDDLHTHAVLLQQSLDGSQTHPQVVGVEHLELLDGLELIHMVLWHLYTEWIVTYTRISLVNQPYFLGGGECPAHISRTHGNDYWQWHKRGMEEVGFCLGVVAQCIVTGLLVTRPGFDSRRKLTFSVPLLV